MKYIFLILTVFSINASALESLVATLETPPVADSGDAADDPAVWVHPSNSAQSLIIGSNKRGGIMTYDLAGRETAYYRVGEINNIDVRDNIVGGVNRTDNSITMMKIDPTTRKLTPATTTSLKAGIEVYGFCFFKSAKSKKLYGFVTTYPGNVEQFEFVTGTNGLEMKKVRSIKLSSTNEGCVADDETGALYVSEETRGIWKFDAEPTGPVTGTLIHRVGQNGLKADVEGLAIYTTTAGNGYLLVSSQGNDSFIVYDRAGNHAFLGSFELSDGPTIDGVSSTDGIEVVSHGLGAAFPNGIFIAQDGENQSAQGRRENQNFKIVDWREIKRALKLR